MAYFVAPVCGYTFATTRGYTLLRNVAIHNAGKHGIFVNLINTMVMSEYNVPEDG